MSYSKHLEYMQFNFRPLIRKLEALDVHTYQNTGCTKYYLKVFKNKKIILKVT